MNTSRPPQESIAIIGMSCRFPYSSSLDEFWELLKNGKDTITEIAKERWDSEKYYDSDPTVERKTNQRHASLLSRIHDFDPLFFNISPAEASEMSPSQKLMLELAWEAIENSTVPFQEVKGNNVGVYVGNIWTDFEHYRKSKNARATLHSAVGMSSNVVANRVSFAMGFTGPSLVIDTGCSASLVALHLACQSLLSRETEMSMVGGINHILDPDKYIELTKFGGLSVNGKCSTFDNDADGFVRGEGGGVIVLKRLSDAERDGNKIYAIIRGTAVNNNGFNDTLPATSIEGQKSLLEKVYREAGIKPAVVHYVEAHGTGTKSGDPNEARALGEFFRDGRTGPKLRVGSVKTNIGHTEATAGIAGLIKVVLAMKNKALPPNLNFKNPNSNIPFDELKLEVQKELSHWPAQNGETFKAGVNSFGWGGTNAHTVLEEYRPSLKREIIRENTTTYCLPLSAKSSPALKAYAKSYLTLLEQGNEAAAIEQCIATALRKPELDHRYLFTGADRNELLESLRNFIADESEVIPYHRGEIKPKIAFVFPGQGGQWLGMGRKLMKQEKVFLKSLRKCDTAFQKYTDWSLLDQLNASEETSRLQEINVIQPMICAMQIALAELWMSWGIYPQAVVGHSMGEVAAAHVSGALSLDDAAKIICTRSLLMKTVSGKGGAMAVTELNREEAEKIVAAYPGKLSVAVNNSPKSTVLAGDKTSIDEVLEELEEKGLFGRLVKVDVASHSSQMDPLKENLRTALQEIVPQATSISFVSTVLNKVMEGEDLDASYWVNNLRGMVQFASVVEKLLADQHTVFIEVNPHPVLVNAVNECAEFYKRKIDTFFSLYRDKPEREELMKNLTAFYGKGYSIPWPAFFGTSVIPVVDLPPYPFQRECFEIEDLSADLQNKKEVVSRFPLLGEKINLAIPMDSYYWESSISLTKFPYLRDHIIHESIELPVSCHIEIIMEAMSELFQGDMPFRMEELKFVNYIHLAENTQVQIQVKLNWTGNQTGKVAIFRKENVSWELLAEADVVSHVSETSSLQQVFEKIEYHAPAYTEGGSYYNLLRSIGQNYGKHFQQLTGLDRIGSRPLGNVLFSIKPDQYIRLTSSKYKVHPALMSSFFQPVFIQLTSLLEEGNLLDVKFLKIGKLSMQGAVNYEREMRGLLVFQHLKKQSQENTRWNFNANIIIANHDNTEVMSITGLEGVAESKVPVKNKAGHKHSASGFLEIYQAGLSKIEKHEALEQMITHHVAGIIKIASSRVKRTMTFKGMGVDSLMAVQLRNQLEKEVSLKLPVGKFWLHPTIQEYAAYLNNELMDLQEMKTISPQKTQPVKNQDAWWIIPQPNPEAAFRLFCFHDAGGSASLFEGWEKYLETSKVEIVLVEMPGRGRRLEETPYTDVQALLRDIIPALHSLLNKPYAFLGHSMGGMVAFEIIRELRRTTSRLPLHLFISSTSGLNAYTRSQVDYALSEEELIRQYPHLHISAIGSREMQSLLITILRADLQFLYHYDYKTEKPLALPITAIHGNEDERVSRVQIEQWESETSSSFNLIPREGGHRYIQHDGEFVARLIVKELNALKLTKSKNKETVL